MIVDFLHLSCESLVLHVLGNTDWDLVTCLNLNSNHWLCIHVLVPTGSWISVKALWVGCCRAASFWFCFLVFCVCVCFRFWFFFFFSCASYIMGIPSVEVFPFAVSLVIITVGCKHYFAICKMFVCAQV